MTPTSFAEGANPEVIIVTFDNEETRWIDTPLLNRWSAIKRLTGIEAVIDLWVEAPENFNVTDDL